MRLEYQDAIKHEIEYVFGRKIVSSRDCLDLSDEIYKKTQKQLNPNTLRRFFGLVKTQYPPSHSTLNILSHYCGFHSAEDVYKLKRHPPAGDLIEQGSLVYYFVSIFDEITISDNCDKTFLTLVEHTIKFLNNNLALVDKFQSLVAKTENGQRFYFEQFVNIDKFNVYYTNGLRYYLNEKRTDDAIVFVHSVLAFKYWLNNDDDKVTEHCKKITAYFQKNSSNAYIYSRYYAALLFEANVSGSGVEDILVNIYKYYSSLEAAAAVDELFYFEYVISEALVLTGHFNDAHFYIGQFCHRARKTEFCKHKMSFQNINLYRAIAFHRTNDALKAANAFNAIKPSEFHFNSKKYASILHTWLSSEIKRKIFKYTESMDTLIAETGFARLKTFVLQPFVETGPGAE